MHAPAPVSRRSPASVSVSVLVETTGLLDCDRPPRRSADPHPTPGVPEKVASASTLWIRPRALASKHPGLFWKIWALGILDRNFSFAGKFLGWPWRRVFELAGVARGVAVEARWAALQPRGRLGTHCRHVAGLGLINFSACDAGEQGGFL